MSARAMQRFCAIRTHVAPRDLPGIVSAVFDAQGGTVLGRKSQIHTTIAERLAPTGSGKFLCTVNEFESSPQELEGVGA